MHSSATSNVANNYLLEKKCVTQSVLYAIAIGPQGYSPL